VPSVWLLHVGIFVVFVPLVFASRARTASTGGTSLRDVFPGWPGIVMGAVMAYAFVNFVLFMQSNEGTPLVRGGVYLLKHETRGLLHISEAQYHAHKALEIRGFSGHWLVFYLAPALYFLVARRRHGGA
jgi:hypothetical protein